MQCLNNRRLLVVDDQEVIHFSFRTVFGNPVAAASAEAGGEAYQVDYATSGETALEIIRKAAGADEPHALAFVDMLRSYGGAK